MVTYFASATATSAKTAYFQFRESTVVTASASATATSTLSQADANQIAQQTAQQIADSTAENEANLMMQTVDVATIGDTIFGLDSSLLSKFIKKVGDNSWTLGENFTVPDGLTLRIRNGDTLDIQKGVTLFIYSKSKLINKGTLNVQGDVTVGDSNGLQNTDVFNNNNSQDLTSVIPTENTTLAPATAITNTVQNDGTLKIDYNASYVINPDTLFANSSSGIINNYGTIENAGTIENKGIVNDYGKTNLNGSATVSSGPDMWRIQLANGIFYPSSAGCAYGNGTLAISSGSNFNSRTPYVFMTLYIDPTETLLIKNKSTFMNKANVYNYGTIQLDSGCTFNNDNGAVYEHGVTINNGTITSTHFYTTIHNIYEKYQIPFYSAKFYNIRSSSSNTEFYLGMIEYGTGLDYTGKIEIPSWMSLDIPQDNSLEITNGRLYVYGQFINHGKLNVKQQSGTEEYTGVYYTGYVQFYNNNDSFKSKNRGTIINCGIFIFYDNAKLLNYTTIKNYYEETSNHGAGYIKTYYDMFGKTIQGVEPNDYTVSSQRVQHLHGNP
jgi:hypothetical protein